MAKVIVVGGGLSGLSAAHTVLERGGNVLLLDKNPFLGGNSTKATSGINGALTRTQIKLGIKDSAESFYDDTARSARDLIRPGLVKVLTGNSASAVEWLQDSFGLDLSLVSQLGGHSFPRTHRGKERFPGMTITYALMEKLEDLAKALPNRVQVVKKARVSRLILDGEGKVTGVEYEFDGKLFQESGIVVLATGGYAADFAENGLIKKYRPDVFNLPTTNGDWSSGDGIKMVDAIGGNTVDMEKVQVHPTGLVDPNEPDAKLKFLAAEALRGCGGLLLDANGHRFADELGHRDYVTGEMNKNKGPFRLVLNGAASKEIEWHCKHYMGRGLMKRFDSGAGLAKEMGVNPSVIEETFTKYNGFAEKKNDPFGKKYFHNLPFVMKDEYYVAIVTPVVHYSMGGVEINPESQIIGKKGPIPGLYACGEIGGGVHGANRLGGSSLLGCVVYGRVAGESASKALFQHLLTHGVDSATKRVGSVANQLTGNNFKVGVNVHPDQRKLTMEIVWNDQGSSSASPFSSNVQHNAVESVQQLGPVGPSAAIGGSTSTAADTVPPKKGFDKNKEYTLEEVNKHKTESDCWVVVNGEVLDVTNFLKDHPGGKKAILIYAGKDASEEFNMLHKPDVVEKYAPDCIIGKLKGGEAKAMNVHGLKENQQQQGPNKIKLVPSNKESRVSGGTADILPAERAKATFNSEKLTNFLDGGSDATKRRRFILSPTIGQDLSDQHNWDQRESLKQHIKHFMEIHEPYWDNFKPTREDIAWMTENSMFAGSMMNHYGLFAPTIDVHGTDQQKGWWAHKARTMQIIGSYAQTELGHGSNVRGLQTTATYDLKAQQFVLNTPTLQSMKWWPGTLGKVATHAIVYAQLILDGKELGVHSFMLQIRDENHKPLPGIELGDLGPKLGDHANDTGYMRLDNVRIPREFMLARYQEVTADGKYVRSEQKEKNAKLHYTTMIFTRGSMVKSSGGWLARAVTIATRYSCVRKQGFLDTKKGASFKSDERQIIDYQVQRYRIFKQLCLTYAIKFTGIWMINRFKDMEGGTVNRLQNIDSLPEIAATSAGLKALCTYLAWTGIEDSRKCCGGNGYLMSSGLSHLAANYVWQTTAEGDWIILMLQTARFLLKAVQNAMEGQPLSDVISYLEPLNPQSGSNFDLNSAALPEAKSPQDFFDLGFLLELYKKSALITVVTVANNFQQKFSELGRFDESLNACAVELVAAVRTHCYTFMLSNFVRAVHDAEKTEPSIKAVLTKVCALYACSNIFDDPQWSGLISAPQKQLVKRAITELLDALRPDAIALVDAFDIPDRVLGSAIGSYDGNVYEALFESAQKSPLNQTDPFDGYKEYLRPHLNIDFLKQGNKAESKL